MYYQVDITLVIFSAVRFGRPVFIYSAVRIRPYGPDSSEIINEHFRNNHFVRSIFRKKFFKHKVKRCKGLCFETIVWSNNFHLMRLKSTGKLCLQCVCSVLVTSVDHWDSKREYKTTWANNSSVFEWLGPKPNRYGPSKYWTCSVFEPPNLY